jgi:hypothetical protein
MTSEREMRCWLDEAIYGFSVVGPSGERVDPTLLMPPQAPGLPQEGTNVCSPAQDMGESTESE